MTRLKRGIRVTDYQGNAHKNREGKTPPTEEKNVEAVVKGDVVLKKKPWGERFKNVFFGGNARNAVGYIVADVFLPTIRNLVVDATTKGMERMVYGDRAETRRRPMNYGSRVQYNTPVRRDRPYLPDQGPRRLSPVRRDLHDFILSDRNDAELVLERLVDLIDKYQVASVADALELMNQPSSHVDNKWGWSHLSNTEIRQVRDGYLLDLPPIEEI